MKIFDWGKKKFSKKNWWYWVPGIVMILLLLVFYSKIHNDLNGDLVAYFSVAKHYQDSNFVQAFNSYWSPLICWLMALAPTLKENPIGVFRLVNIAVALTIYYQLFFWVRLVVYQSFSRFLLMLLLVALVVQLALSIGTPDFLSLSCFLLFLKLLIRYRFYSKQSVLLTLSILLCYFSKTFLLFLCLGILGLYLIYLFFILKKKIAGKQLFIMLLVVFSGLFIWASCLKLHYGFYTLSSSASVNNSLLSKEIISLQAPPFEKSLFMWEDPYYIKRTSAYNSSVESIRQFLIKKYTYNFGITLYYFRYLSYLWLAILVFPFLGIFQKHDRQWKISLLLFFVFILNWFGYFLVFIMERYLIIGQVALYMAVFGYLEILCKAIPEKITAFRIQQFVFFFVFLCMLKNPLDELRYGLRTYEGPHHEICQAKHLADSGILKGKKIATFYDSKELYDYLSLACFEGDGKYFGEIWTGKPTTEQRSEMKQQQLDFIVVYDCDLIKDNCNKKDWLSDYPVVYKDAVMKVKIYDMQRTIGYAGQTDYRVPEQIDHLFFRLCLCPHKQTFTMQ